MELKLNEIDYLNKVQDVLIVPLWNWNNKSERIGAVFFSSNRTFMELKFKQKEKSYDVNMF